MWPFKRRRKFTYKNEDAPADPTKGFCKTLDWAEHLAGQGALRRVVLRIEMDDPEVEVATFTWVWDGGGSDES